MRVLLTGATGFIGSHILPELIGAGHEVLGLTRSDDGARRLEQAGAQPYRGTIDDPRSLMAGAEQADAVIHTAFDHDFSRFVENCAKDARLIEALGAVLAGTGKPFIITSGTGMGSNGPGKPATEDTVDWNNPNPRIASEKAGADALAKGASVAVVRLPQVHDTLKQGLISPLIAIARTRGVSAYIGDGANRWPAAHVTDVARLYRLALEKHEAGIRYHASAEAGVPARAIAEAIGNGLGLPVISLAPEKATEHFGWMGSFMSYDMPSSSEWTRRRLDWQPDGPSLIADLEAMDYGALPSFSR
ncbi:SDR family oxidoreductase [Sphingomonas fennica]|uniref:NAD-dependent dehydratase n=1 Tax=Edaphosphingomonas fennica TaxID=114404 RepID=A0A2T4I7A5_9SPHN|nr:SDR family oxidoreductase [Sphingomonas fennica]PTD27059.1 NAD-dependent dehydratase [Sphingomonas fennica]